MKKTFFLHKFAALTTAAFVFSAFSLSPIYSNAASDSLMKQMEDRKKLKVASNEIEDWPKGPSVGAESAIVMDIDSKAILYSKNIDEKLYPASTTKMLTCLIAAERGNLSDKVTFSSTAVKSVPADGSNIGIDAGESMTLEECLYGVMVGSANECANAAAEHIGGSIEGFAKIMNTRAKELGCKNSHFVNANGLFNENHYTSSRDLALIACAFFNNDSLSRIGNTRQRTFKATPTQPDTFTITNKHKLINGEFSYSGILGGKTGYTGEARNTLVTGCEKNGMRLVCVVMKEESPCQFSDTVSLFDYAFNNFHKINVSTEDNGSLPSNENFFSSQKSLFASASNVLYFGKNDTIILPIGSSISDCKRDVVVNKKDDKTGIVATVKYLFNGADVGNAQIYMASDKYQTDNINNTKKQEKKSDKTIYINVYYLFLLIVVVSLLVIWLSYTIPSGAFLRTLYRDPSEKRHYKRRKKEMKKRRLR